LNKAERNTPLETRCPSVHIRTMPDKRLKRPRDPAQLAKLMIDIASGEVEDGLPTAKERKKDRAMVDLATMDEKDIRG